LQQAAQAITSEEDPFALLNKIIRAALTVIDAADGSVSLLDEETDELVFVAVQGELSRTLPGHRMPKDTGIAGWVVSHGRPEVLNNVRMDSRFSSLIDELFQFKTYSLLAVPMIWRGRALGVIEVLNKFSRQDFTQTDVELLTTLAYIAAAAIHQMDVEERDSSE
jgi:signal transduction protein with GAF and PtsI domain